MARMRAAYAETTRRTRVPAAVVEGWVRQLSTITGSGEHEQVIAMLREALRSKIRRQNVE